jgi:hypothetical protein
VDKAFHPWSRRDIIIHLKPPRRITL